MKPEGSILMMDDPAEQTPAGVQQPVTPSNPDDGKTMVEQLQQAAEVKIPTPPPSYTEAVKGETASAPKDKKQEAQPAPSEPVSQQQVQSTPQPKQNQPAVSNKKKMSDETKRILLVSAAGLVTGSIIGAVAMNMKHQLATQAEQEEISDSPEGTTTESTGLFDEGLSGTMQADDSQSFGEAFAHARQQLGASGVFKWRGKLYGTMYKDEWDNLSDEDRQQYAQQVQSIDLEEDSQSGEETAEPSAETSEAVEESVQAEDAPTEAESSTTATVEEPVTAPNPDYEITPEEGELLDDEEEGELLDDEEEGELLDDEEESELLDDEEESELLEDEEESELLEDEEEGELLDDEEESELLDDEEEGELLDDEEEEIEEDEPMDDEESDDFEDYENDEDPSAFL